MNCTYKEIISVIDFAKASLTEKQERETSILIHMIGCHVIVDCAVFDAIFLYDFYR
jgi:hypothetical protein